MCLRPSPPPFSPGVIGMNTLVATTTSSRERNLVSRRPVATSLAPFEYVSAVSKNVMPPSTAARTIGSAAASSSTQARSLSLPKLIIPRHTRDTRRPVAPRLTYCMRSSGVAGGGDHHLRHNLPSVRCERERRGEGVGEVPGLL